MKLLQFKKVRFKFIYEKVQVIMTSFIIIIINDICKICLEIQIDKILKLIVSR